ncbi:MAG TPA: BlaI/MecI/CopY family transcriptional regulator [Pirellulales bacterium]|jgi:predicted transcriptional regulator|nr:BlaI/MecI/CopY family transcriptional regulator [Pirellulales bacterium]
MPQPSSPLDVGKRERQIVEAVYRLGEASVAQVRAELSDPPSYSAVRAVLMTLVGKRVVTFRQVGKKYLYRARTPHQSAGRSALRRLLQTFFAGKPSGAVAALLDVSAGSLTGEELDRMRTLIEQARKET